MQLNSISAALTQLLLMFNKIVFLLLNIPHPPFSMLEYNITITHSNSSVLYNIEMGDGGEKQREVKSANLPNTFDYDCSNRKVIGLTPVGRTRNILLEYAFVID